MKSTQCTLDILQISSIFIATLPLIMVITIFTSVSNFTQHTGQMIREARLKAGLTQKELGERLGVSESAITKLENRKTAPAVSTLERVAKAIGKKLEINFV